MPNWCSTSLVIEGDKNEIIDLYGKMRSLEERKESLLPNNFGKTWLGNLVTILGGNWEKIYCRGYWFGLTKDDDDGAIRFCIESAWSEPRETLRFIFDCYKKLNIYYIADEPGNGHYVTNDDSGEFFPERFAIINYDECGETEWFEDEDDFLKRVGELLGCEVSSIMNAYFAVQKDNNHRTESYLELQVYKVIDNELRHE